MNKMKLKNNKQLTIIIFLTLGLLLPVKTGAIDFNPLAEKQNPTEVEAKRFFQQGNLEYQNRQFEAAIASFQQALQLYRQSNNLKKELVALGQIGASYQGLKNYSTAINYFQQALTIAEAINHSEYQALSQGFMGYNQEKLGNYARAITSYEQSLSLWEKIGNKKREAEVLQGLGNVQLRLGNYEIALELQLKSLEIAQSMEDIPGLIEATNSMGAIYSNQGNYSQATLYYKESLELAKQINNSPAEIQALNNLGSVAHAQRNFAAAKTYYQEAQAIAIATGDLLVEANALAGIGLVEANLKHYSSAIKYQQQSREIAEQIEDRPLQARILNNLGYTLWQANNLEAAVTHLQAAINLRASLHEELTEDLDRVSLFDTQVRTYNLLQQILVQQQQYPAALAAAEAGRARPFITLLQGDSKPPTIAELQQIAREQEATLVEYSLIPDPEFIGQGKLKGAYHKLYIWVVQPKGAIAFRQVDLTSLESSLGEIVARSRYAMGIGGRSLTVQFAPPEEQGTTLQELHSILIEPIADLLPANPQQRVIFIPHNELFLVPFPALQNSSGEYLIAQHPIVTAPAIQVLGNTRQQRQAASGKGILIVGNPTMPEIQLQIGQPPQQLDPLPGAEAEAKAIARILNGDALIGHRATKNTVLKQLPQARIIHLATHGLLDEIQGLKIPGAIALAPKGDDDGILTAAEILELELSPELVVLSACNTGKGEIVGDGVLGLSRSLIAAGTPSAIVSLWAVPDAPTAQLMTAFYRNWQSEPDKAQALRQAMLTTMKTHPNPRDWAAFTLIGEAN